MNAGTGPEPAAVTAPEKGSKMLKWSTRILFLLCLTLAACHKKPSKAARPTPASAPARLEPANNDYEAGRYPEAALAYQAYLDQNPKAARRDEALFKLGIATVLSGSSPQSWIKAQAPLQTLVAEYPRSRYRPEAEYILTLQTEVEKLRLDSRDRDEKIRARDGMIRERDEKIRRLTQELERLKKIDLERRPSRPPE
jgi:outer membrane protein assembly factor BamD (BamD/ComL family)